LLAAVSVVGVLLGGLFFGFEPDGGDPDQMYRPIKFELARSLAAGTVPYWSDALGVGVPLVAESHIAAFYPLNRLFYRFLSVEVAYRLSMWLHYVGLAAATFVYARTLRIAPAGAAVSAVAFTLCGFQATHAIHEPFYLILPYVVLCLILTERFMASGHLAWFVALAVAYGISLTLGHFQLQAFAGGLVLVTGLWRAASERRPWQRAALLPAALVWGAMIAAVQLVPTWEMMQFARPAKPIPASTALFYAYPPGHWPEIVIPRLFRTMRDGPDDKYWIDHASSPVEACLYIGTIPLILVFLGWVRRNRALAPWKVLAPASFAFATMPQWWPAGYLALLNIPIVGSFRGPGRYTVVTSLALCLIAGEGLTRAMSSARFWIGLSVAGLFGLVATGWAIEWARQPTFDFRNASGGFSWAMGLAALSWALSVGALVAWRFGRVRTMTLLILSALELALLYYTGTTDWGWALHAEQKSPVIHALKADRAQRVAGFLHNLPMSAEIIPACPYLGFRDLPPYPAFESFQSWERAAFETTLHRMHRYGITHGAWDGPYDRYLRRDGYWLDSGAPGLMFFTNKQGLYAGEDRVLDRACSNMWNSRPVQSWRAVRYEKAFPPARIAIFPRAAHDADDMERGMGSSTASDDVWYLQSDMREPPPEPRARSAVVRQWSGNRGIVAREGGGCYLVLMRTYYPGWVARVDGGPERPVLRVEGGLQAIRLDGPGVSSVEVRYRPTGLVAAWVLTILGIVFAILLLTIAAGRAFLLHRRRSVS
jgi:hypothetical protein